MLTEIMAQQGEILKIIMDLKSEQASQKSSLAVVAEKGSAVEKLVSKASKSTRKIDQFYSSLKELKTSVVDTSEKIVDIEDRSPCSNLLVFWKK